MYKSTDQEITQAIDDFRRGYRSHQPARIKYRSPNRVWDWIICKVCPDCGKPLVDMKTKTGWRFVLNADRFCSQKPSLTKNRGGNGGFRVGHDRFD